MSAVLKARIVRIGNSHGVRIPKVWLDQLELGAEVEMKIEAQQIIIRSAQHPRQGWEAHYQAMAAASDDRLLDEPDPTQWEVEEWHW